MIKPNDNVRPKRLKPIGVYPTTQNVRFLSSFNNRYRAYVQTSFHILLSCLVRPKKLEDQSKIGF